MTENQKQWSIILGAILLGASIAGYKLYKVFIPAASEYIAQKVPDNIYQVIGEASLDSLDESEFTKSELTPEQQNNVKQQYQELITHLNLPIEKFQLHFRNWDGKMNAFALMDGSIVITDLLVQQLENSQQLQAVLLHEIGHIEHNHLMESSIRLSLFYISMSLFFGDIGFVSDILIESSVLGANLSYSRDFEIEADLYASEKLISIYGTSEGMTQALELLYSQSATQQFHWLSTHPTLSERVSRINQSE